MRSFVIKFLVLTLLSFNGYAGPFNGGPGGRIGPDNRPDIRPNIRPGERGSNIQEALGSSQNQYSPLNPGSNQSVFLLNNFISQQLLNEGPGAISNVTLNPVNPLNNGPFERDIHSEPLPLVERDLTSNFILMSPPRPFASKVTKSRTQGMVFVKKSSQPPEDSTGLINTDSYIAGPGFAIGAVLKFKMHKDQPTQAPIWSPVASGATAKLTAARSQGAGQVEQAINKEAQLIEATLSALQQTSGQIAQSQIQDVLLVRQADVSLSSARAINAMPPSSETPVGAVQIENEIQMITQQIQEQLTMFNNMLQTTEQTLGGMSQPESSDSSGSSGSK